MKSGITDTNYLDTYQAVWVIKDFGDRTIFAGYQNWSFEILPDPCDLPVGVTASSLVN